eukprot:TRINITY_DN5492_c0_g1_i1.p1 TRINITY_DN5492_c0_g1~~TRINITY_DN5492_c0_g1_i1.p1  ORF type:complete len:339 (+),score=74.93 TRINITY_DN5492_c0_g1_i1:194-1210(+)
MSKSDSTLSPSSPNGKQPPTSVVAVKNLLRLQSITSRKFGLICAILAHFFAASNGCIIKTLSHLPYMQVVITRGLMSLMINLVMLNALGIRGELKNLLKTPMIVYGFLHFFCHVTFIVGVRYISIGTAIAIIGASPIFVAIFATLILKESFRLNDLLSCIIGFSGILILSRFWLFMGSSATTSNNNTDSSWFFAAIILVLNAISGALAVCIQRKSAGSMDSLVISMFPLVSSFLYGSIIGVGVSVEWAPLSWMDWVKFVSNGIIFVFSYFLSIMATQFIQAFLVQILAYTCLVYGLLFDIFIFGKTPQSYDYIGSLFVCASSLLVLNRGKKPEGKQCT